MTQDNDIDNLARIPLFAIFEESALRKIAFSAESRVLRTGETLFRRGEESDGGFVLTMGSLGLFRREDDPAPAHVLRPWALIGETALVAPSARPASARAMEPATLLRISRALIHDILEQHPDTAARARNFFRDRLVDFTRNAAASLSHPEGSAFTLRGEKTQAPPSTPKDSGLD